MRAPPACEPTARRPGQLASAARAWPLAPGLGPQFGPSSLHWQPRCQRRRARNSSVPACCVVRTLQGEQTRVILATPSPRPQVHRKPRAILAAAASSESRKCDQRGLLGRRMWRARSVQPRPPKQRQRRQAAPQRSRWRGRARRRMRAKRSSVHGQGACDIRRERRVLCASARFVALLGLRRPELPPSLPQLQHLAASRPLVRRPRRRRRSCCSK